MATYPAIAATSQAIVGLLEGAAAQSEFAGTDFEHYNAEKLQDPMDEGVSLYLYRVVVSTTRRNLPPRTDPDGRRYRPSLPLDLHYLLIAWADDPLQQQRLLAWCARTLEDTPVLPAGLLNHYGPEPDVFRESEAVELVLEPLTAQELLDVWDVAKTHAQPSLTYAARMLEIESSVPVDEYGLAQTRAFDYAEASG